MGITAEQFQELFTRLYSHERMITFALAAQKAVEQSAGVIPKDKAMSIIAEYGWRTSHYMWE